MRRGFVIQLYPEANISPTKFAGRVEHVDRAAPMVSVQSKNW
jgi:hypothetical protein